jgi:glycerol-3-phosphate dehydrogenase (NAD(P)+)
MSKTIAKPVVCILGGGTWGTTLAHMLSLKRLKVRIWDIDKQVVESLVKSRIPYRLPHVYLSTRIMITNDLQAALHGANTIVIAIPSHGMRPLCKQLKTLGVVDLNAPIIIGSKGLDTKRLMTLSGVALDVIGEEVRSHLCILSGPSHAEEVSRGVPTSVVASAYHQETAQVVQQLFMTSTFRVYTHQDVLGVELGGALKNIIAIAAGVCDGLRLGDNAKAALLTRGLAEIIRLGKAMGADVQTFTGLAGVGDLIVTALSRHSRNRAFGERIARGLTVEEAQRQIGMVVEGIKTTQAARQLAKRHAVSMPITEEVYNVIFKDRPPKEAVARLMRRSPKPEIYE